jgi:membrane-associated protease RseP (regulator of RpoE activity)
MSDPTPPLAANATFDPPPPVVLVRPRRPRYWIHAVLLLLTIFTTLVVGAGMEFTFQNDFPAFTADEDSWVPFFPLAWVLLHPARLLLGIPFSFSLLLILLAHEMGHYVYCMRYNVRASLPYFVPFPSLIGTMGAFIRIRGAIRSRAALFDIGIAGPLAGFAVALPMLFLGLRLSKFLPAMPAADIELGYPLIFRLAHGLLSAAGGTGAPLAAISLHPIAIAAWVGMFATALNLLPGGQLDGGHLIYAVAPRAHRWITILMVGILLPLGDLWRGWYVWSFVLLLTGWRHPEVPPWPTLDRKRRLLALGALLLLLLCVTPVPIRTPGLFR